MAPYFARMCVLEYYRDFKVPSIYKSPEQLLKRFNQIVGSISSGNSSKRLYNEATNILDALRADKVINKAEYSKLYKKYLAI